MAAAAGSSAAVDHADPECDDASIPSARASLGRSAFSYTSADAAAAGGTSAELMQRELPDFVANAPAPIRGVLEFFVFSLLLVHDDFDTSLRKIAVGVISPLGCVGAVLACASTAIEVGGFPASKPGTFSVIVLYALVSAGFLAPWVVLKCSKRADELAVLLILTIVSVATLMLAFTDVTYPTWVAFGQIATGAQIVRAKHLGAVFGFCVLGFLAGAYNALVLKPAMPVAAHLAALPDPLVRTSFVDRLTVLIAPGFFFVVNCVAIHALLKEATRREAAQSASVTVASTVADALARYDTTLAQRHLDEARGDGAADGALIARLELIVANLDRYRPHLPNWLLIGIADGDEPSRRVEIVADDSGTAHSSPTAERSQRATTAICDRFSASSHDSTESTVHSVYGQSMTLLSPPAGTLTTYAAHESGTPFKARVALAEVAFSIPSTTQLIELLPITDVAAAVPLMAAAGHAFVDRVHRLAGGTSGAVHAFVGDVARVSWNAAAKAVQPEAKAARFLARLKHDAGHELVRAWGAAATGDARVQLAGSRQQALLVTASGGGAEALRAGLRVAARHGAFVVDGTTYAGARHAVRFRGCGLMRRAQGPPSDAGLATQEQLEGAASTPNASFGEAPADATPLPGEPAPPPSATTGTEAPERLVATPPLHRHHANRVAPTYRRARRRIRSGLFAVVEECETANDAASDWVYVVDPAASGTGDPRQPSAVELDERTCRAVELAAAGDHAAALELLDDYAQASGAAADPSVLEFAADLGAR